MTKKLLLLICTTLFLFSEPLTPVEQQEAKAGEKYFKEILEKVTLSNDTKRLKKIKKIGLKLAKIINKDYEWEFVLVQDKALNAFCLPGGKVVVYTGIFKVIENDDQLATVMSHEIAHVLLRHGGLKGKADAILNIPQKIGKNLFGELIPKELHGVLDTVHNIGKQVTIMMPYARHQEKEADRLGIKLMKEAGYDPLEAIQLWENIKKISSDQPPEFLSTHPDHDERIEVIKDEITGSKK